MTGNRIRSDVDHTIAADAVGLEYLHDLEERARLPGEVVLTPLGRAGELGRHLSIEQCAALPIDLKLLGARSYEYDQFSAREGRHLQYRYPGPRLGAERADPVPVHLQRQLDHRLVIDGHSRFIGGQHIGKRENAVGLQQLARLLVLGEEQRQHEGQNHDPDGDADTAVQHPARRRFVDHVIHHDENWPDDPAQQRKGQDFEEARDHVHGDHHPPVARRLVPDRRST
ncbi:Uncharacterised protein [Mycobacteroides abscessus subsp. massiliense]|nr:Uncharacterised protein [Mycobacteroides abscessus subsp. massiliense]